MSLENIAKEINRKLIITPDLNLILRIDLKILDHIKYGRLVNDKICNGTKDEHAPLCSVNECYYESSTHCGESGDSKPFCLKCRETELTTRYRLINRSLITISKIKNILWKTK